MSIFLVLTLVVLMSLICCRYLNLIELFLIVNTFSEK
jgi:hypothetical protein